MIAKHRLPPDLLATGLLLAVCLLWLSERFQWFGFDHHKGWAVLIALGTVAATILVMLLWWVASLIFDWRFQFGIRSLLILAVVCSVAFAWLAVEKTQSEKQRRAVEEIEGLVGAVSRDFETDAAGMNAQTATPPGSAWLRNLLGDDFFSNVSEVSFLRMGDLMGLVIDGDKIRDAGLVNLKDLPQLKRLQLFSSYVTNEGLANIACLSQLESLELRGRKITGAGLVHIAGLRRLRSLELNGIDIADGDLKSIEGLTALNELELNSTHISGAGLEHLKGLAELHVLGLEGTRVTDAGLEWLSGLTQLRSLDLADTKATDAGLRYLNGLAHLESLDLTDTKVTDAGLGQLRDLSRLGELDLFGTRVTVAGVEKLQRALPNCNIWYLYADP